MIHRVARGWGRLVGRYSRLVVNRRRVVAIIDAVPPAGPCIWIAWHETNLITVALHRMISGRPVVTFVPDGVRGAAMEGWVGEFGIEAVALPGDVHDGLGLRRMRTALDNGAQVIIAVDGPSGPRRVPRPGALWLSAETGAPVMPVGCAAVPAVRVPRWDRHLVPLPGARIAVVLGAPIEIPLDPRSDATGAAVADVLNRLTARAEAALASPTFQADARQSWEVAPWR